MKRAITLQAALAMTLLSGACSPPASLVVDPLRVVHVSPGGGSYCVDPTTHVVAVFSHPLNVQTVTARTVQLLSASGPIEVSVDYDDANQAVTLIPLAPLPLDRTYTLRADEAIESAEQGPLIASVETSFKTISRRGCMGAPPQCQRPSDCNGLEQEDCTCCATNTCTCSSVGWCEPQCITDQDCWQGHCDGGACQSADEGGPTGSGGQGG